MKCVNESKMKNQSMQILHDLRLRCAHKKRTFVQVTCIGKIEDTIVRYNIPTHVFPNKM